MDWIQYIILLQPGCCYLLDKKMVHIYIHVAMKYETLLSDIGFFYHFWKFWIIETIDN